MALFRAQPPTWLGVREVRDEGAAGIASTRATVVPVARSIVGHARPLRDLSPSTVEIHTVGGQQFASGGLGFESAWLRRRVPLCSHVPPLIRPNLGGRASMASGNCPLADMTKAAKIFRPVLFGENGVPEVSYEIDAFHDGLGRAVEVEAGRGAANNADYRDIDRTSLILDADYLVLLMPDHVSLDHVDSGLQPNPAPARGNLRVEPPQVALPGRTPGRLLMSVPWPCTIRSWSRRPQAGKYAVQWSSRRRFRSLTAW